MSQRYDIDLETERLSLDGTWLTADELTARLTQLIAAKNFGGVGRLGDALEQLSQAVNGAQSLTLKLSSEHFAKLEAAGAKLGKPAAVFARDLLMQVLAGAPAQAAPAFAPAPLPVAAPAVTITAPPPAPPVIAAPAMAAPVLAPPVLAPAMAAPVPLPPVVSAAADVSPEEAAQALPMTPKRRDAYTAGPPAPPVMTPVAPGASPSVVIDMGPEDPKKPAAGGPPGADGRRWFNRS